MRFLNDSSLPGVPAAMLVLLFLVLYDLPLLLAVLTVAEELHLLLALIHLLVVRSHTRFHQGRVVAIQLLGLRLLYLRGPTHVTRVVVYLKILILRLKLLKAQGHWGLRAQVVAWGMFQLQLSGLKLGWLLTPFTFTHPRPV